MQPSRGGHRETVTSKGEPSNGYRPRLTPGNLMKFLAKGQSSTDLIEPERKAFRSSVTGIQLPGIRY